MNSRLVVLAICYALLLLAGHPLSAEARADVDPLEIGIRNAKMPAEDLLVGGQPTPEQLAEVAKAGFHTVVNLRASGEQSEWDEAEKSAELGMAYFALPIASGKDLTADKARRLDEILSSIDALPALVHCASGNRVGALLALKAFYVEGDDTETALRKGTEAGLTGLTDIVKEHLATAER